MPEIRMPEELYRQTGLGYRREPIVPLDPKLVSECSYFAPKAHSGSC